MEYMDDKEFIEVHLCQKLS